MVTKKKMVNVTMIAEIDKQGNVTLKQTKIENIGKNT